MPRQEQAHLDVADEDVGDDLADHDLDRTRGHGEEILHGAALAFAGDRKPGDKDHGHRENHAHQARHDVVLRNGFRVIKRVNAQIDGSVRSGEESQGPFEIVLQCRAEQGAQGAQGVAGGSRVGRVGFDKKGGPLPPKEIAREILRDVYDKLHLAAGEHVVGFGFGLHLPDEVDIAAVLNGMEQRPALGAVVSQKNGCRQVLRV